MFAQADITGLLVVPFVVAIAIGSIWWHWSRAATLLAQWANANELILVRQQYCWFFRGPFFWSGKGQAVYRVTVRDRAGNVRTGWVRCGGWFLGLLSDRVEARWDLRA